MHRSIVTLVALACLAPSSAALGDVLVVDDSGGGDFTYIQGAIDVASDGDVVLVKPGDYADFLIGGKGVAIVAATPGTVTSSGGALILDLAAGQEVLISGLVLRGNELALEHGLSVKNCAGAVRLESCTFEGIARLPGDQQTKSYAGATVESCAAVSFDGCTLIGGAGAIGTFPCAPPVQQVAGAALVIEGSSVAIHGSTLAGGDGVGAAGCTRADGGGAGVVASGSTLFVARTSIAGGAGGHGFACGCGGDGGDALVLDASTADLFDVALAPGQPSPGSSVGAPGDALALTGGATVNDHAGVAPELIAPAAASVGDSIVLAVHGTPGELAVLGASVAPGFLPIPALHGVLLIQAPPAVTYQLGTIQPAGEVFATFPAPPLPPGLEAASIDLQVVAVDLTGSITLTGSRTLIVLAPGLLP